MLADPKHPLAGPGHVMIVSIPYLVTPDRDELDALLQWTRRGNTVLIAVTLNDTLPWSFSSNALDALDAFEYLTAMSVEVKPRAEAPAREDWPKDYVSVPAAAGHWLTQDVHEIATRSESLTDAWNLTVNPRMPAYVLATTPTTNADALLLSSVGAGALVICTYGSLLENSMLGQRDNRSLVVNLLRHHLASGGRVIFDDGHQGLHTIYDAQAFLNDPRLWGSLGVFLAFWVLYAVLAESRLGPPVDAGARARQTDFVRMLAAFFARKVSRRDAGLRLIGNFLAQVAPRTGAADATQCRGLASRRRIAAPRPCTDRIAAARPRAPARWRHRETGRSATPPAGCEESTFVTSTRELEQHLQAVAGAVVFGATDVVRAITVALVMRGHILLEGVPGIGKTRLSKRVAAALGGTFQRIQGTADLMPSDITGVHVFERDSSRFAFRPGPMFADIVLVDEINRAGPKTQSALLEAMQERQVTVDRDTMPLPVDFLVIATQNPRELEGTYPLPESQLDRFLVRIEMSYPDAASERRALEAYGREASDTDPPVAALDPRACSQTCGPRLRVSRSATALHEYVLAIAGATRQSKRLALGLSTRGALALLRCARVAAAMDGETYVTPDHVRRVAPDVINHRVMLAPEAMLENPHPVRT